MRSLSAAILVLAAGACGPSDDLESGRLSVVTEVEQCPLVDDVMVIPLEVLFGGKIEVSAAPTFGKPNSLWRATEGRFDDPLADTTTYFCETIGKPVLTFTVWEHPNCKDSVDVEVTCSASPSCSDGTLDPGEQCDDGNVMDGDGCSAQCLVNPPRLAGPD